MSDNNIISIAEVHKRSIEEQTKDFGELLKSIESLDDKKRSLWSQIYENAVADRQNSYVMFSDLMRVCDSKSTELAVHGRTIAMFVERMSKANDQLIKLAELVADAQGRDQNIDVEEMFSKIGNG